MPAAEASKGGKVRATIRLPRPLYEEARRFAEDGSSGAGNFNDFLVAALRMYVKMLERRRIDASFARMAEDADLQKEAKLIAEAFSTTDWEALELTEKDPVEA